MGLIANYQYLSDENLKELKEFSGSEDDLMEQVEEWNEEADILLDIDKMWDVLHFVLTGVDSSEPIENDPLSEAVVGVSVMEGIENFIAYTDKSKVADVLSALEDFDIESAMDEFSMEDCKKADLYPNIWDYEEEEDEIKEEITDYFEAMINFYRKILETNGNVLVSIYQKRQNKRKNIVITEQGKEQIRLFEQEVRRFRDCIVCSTGKMVF